MRIDFFFVIFNSQMQQRLPQPIQKTTVLHNLQVRGFPQLLNALVFCQLSKATVFSLNLQASIWVLHRHVLIRHLFSPEPVSH
jgi:hypothetical protein